MMVMNQFYYLMFKEYYVGELKDIYDGNDLVFGGGLKVGLLFDIKEYDVGDELVLLLNDGKNIYGSDKLLLLMIQKILLMVKELLSGGYCGSRKK